MENDFNPAVLASSTLVIVLSFVVMFAVQRFVGLESLIRNAGQRRMVAATNFPRRRVIVAHHHPSR